MRKIIRGKMYNTDTAEKLGLYFNGDLYLTEVLYRKRTGEFFLHGIDQIKPLTVEQAKEWAEKYLDTKDYNKIFGDIVEDDERVTLCISCTKDERDIIKRNASIEGLSISKYIITRCSE